LKAKRDAWTIAITPRLLLLLPLRERICGRRLAFPAPGFRQGSEYRRHDQRRGGTAEIKVHRLRGNVAVLEGSGGNVAVLIGPDGKLLVDAGIAVSKQNMTKALASLGPDPIRHLINTHWHFDHADGNEWLHSEGASIIAQENTRKHLMAAQRVEDWDYDFPPSPSGAIPAEVFKADRTLDLNGSNLVLKYYGPAHTDGDISVRLRNQDIFHAADTYWNGIYPFIDYSTGGSIDGMIAATKANLDATDRFDDHHPWSWPAGQQSI
jgi:glyoxylase-like metal-dependent hydrolase (beta-lactamase superfamily II)